MKTLRKVLSLFLALALVFSLTTVFAATEAEPAVSEPETETAPATEETPAGPPVDLKQQIVDESEVPDCIDYAVALAEKYVCRAYWEEQSLNEVVFLKQDGSLARYYFSFPVKYEKDGEVYDKSPELTVRESLLSGKYRYELTAQNDTQLYCGDNLSQGFLFADGDFEVSLRPITESEYDFLRGVIHAEDLVLPGGIQALPETFDSPAVTGVAQSALSQQAESSTAAVYALSTAGQTASLAAAADTLSVVPSYTGFQMELNRSQTALQSKIFFELTTEKLVLVRQKDTLLLYDAKGNPVGIVGDLLSEYGVYHDVLFTVTPLENGKYLLAATLPQGAGSYTMSVTTYYTGMEDASIYSNDAQKYGQSANLWVGFHNSSHIERVIIRPQTWYFIDDNYPNQAVQNARLILRDVTVTSQQQIIECRGFNGPIAWEEDNMNWAAANYGSYGPLYSSLPVSSSIGASSSTGYYYHFDVTNAISNWYVDNLASAKGLILRWYDDETHTSGNMEKCFASTQYSTERYRPRFEITSQMQPNAIEDGIYAIIGANENVMELRNPNVMTNSLIDSDLSGNFSVFSNSQSHFWRIKSTGDGYYTIRPLYCTLSGLAYNGTTISTQDIGTSDNATTPSSGKWRISAVSGYYTISPSDDVTLAMGDDLSITTLHYMSLETLNGFDTDQLWRFVEVPESSYNEGIQIFDRYHNCVVSTGAQLELYAGEVAYMDQMRYAFAIVTEGAITGVYPLSTGTGYLNTVDYGAHSGRSYVHALNPGEDSIIFECYGVSGYITVTVPVKVSVLEGTIHWKNLGSHFYFDMQNPGGMEDSLLCQKADSFCANSAKWELQHAGNGYYTMRSVYSYGTVLLHSDTANEEVVLNDVSGLSTVQHPQLLWRIQKTPSGGFRIFPKSLETTTQCLTVSSVGQEGALAVMGPYTEDSSLGDEWGMRVPVYRITQQTDMWCWAACSQMLEQKYQEVSMPQSELVDTIISELGLNVAEPEAFGATPPIIEFTVEHLTNKAAIHYEHKYYEDDVLRQILDGGNLVMRIMARSGAKHASVIYDYFVDSEGEYRYKVYDPDSETMSTDYSYADVTINENETWRGSILYEIGPYYNGVA